MHITQKLVQSEKECHVMVATYPCTKYAPIADIHGVRTGVDLFLHFFRHVAIRRPELYVVENVPGTNAEFVAGYRSARVIVDRAASLKTTKTAGTSPTPPSP